MGKRRRERESDEEYDDISKKIKKLEKRLQRRRPRRHKRRREPSYKDSTESPSDHEDYPHEDRYSSLSRSTSRASLPMLTSPPLQQNNEQELSPTCHEQSPPSAPLPTVASVINTANILNPTADVTETVTMDPPAVASVSTPDVCEGPELDTAILEIFGDDPSNVKEYGPDIQSDLAKRLEYITTTGLSIEIRKELIGKFLPPANCALIDAPTLNPEIKVAISESVQKRDKGIEIKQKQLCRAITCIAQAIGTLVNSSDKDTKTIKLLMEASRLLCDNQFQDSITRRNFILFNIKKEMKDSLINTKIDKTLFGTNLAETLKNYKSISRSGAELKTTYYKPAIKNRPLQATSQPQRNNLNWKAPPQTRRLPGNQRTRGPAQRKPLETSSRKSQRTPQTAYRHSRRC